MATRTAAAVLALAGVAWHPAAAQEPTPPAATPGSPPPPVDLGTVERQAVHLVLLDVIVLDGDDRPVAGLAAPDFEVRIAGRPVPVDTVDLRCDQVGDEAVETEAGPAPGDEPRRIVLALDYQHLSQIQRVDVLEQTRTMVLRGDLAGAEIMVAALNGGLRIEQPFTRDAETVARTLQRMQYDVSLWQPSFDHLTEHGFVRGLTALLDVLGTIDGTKAVVLYSEMQDVPLDLEFERIAAVASTARCMLYPVDVEGLTTYASGVGAAGGEAVSASPG